MVLSKRIQLSTKGDCDIIDITSPVAHEIAASIISDGIAVLFITGSTAGITTIEYEPGLTIDFKSMWDRIIPARLPYEHDRAWGDANGHSHIRSALLGTSLTVPFLKRKLTLGTWQQIVLIDFDNRPRTRDIVLQLIGE